MCNLFHFAVLILDTNYLDVIQKVCYTMGFMGKEEGKGQEQCGWIISRTG